MSWPQWPGATGVPQPGVVQAPLLNPAPNVLNPAATMMPSGQYTPEQWTQMQQQNWQQWAQWQQQFQQWQQQYGAEYQKSITAMAAQTRPTPVQPPVPFFNVNTNAPPPLPVETKPPPPPDDPQLTPPVNSLAQFPSFTSAPPPIPQVNYNTAPPPQPPPSKDQFPNQFNSNPSGNAPPPLQGGFPNRTGDGQQRFGGNQNYSNANNRGPNNRNSNWQNQNNRNQQGFGGDRFNQPPGPVNDARNRGDFGGKRPFSQPNDAGDPKRNKLETNSDGNKWQGNQQQPKWEAPPANQPENSRWNVKPPEIAPKHNPEELTEAEKKFDKQFGDWESQFQKWKEQNANHPDKEQYREYEKKWEAWRTQLLDRREQMRRKRLGLTGDSPQPAGDKPKVENEEKLTEPPAPQPQIGAQSFQKPSLLGPGPQASQKPGLLGFSPAGFNLDQFGNKPNITLNRLPHPTLNDQPLDFKKSKLEHSKGDDAQNDDGGEGFLKSASTGGIPGLDLVKEGKEEPKADEELENQKRPDLEAISRGINSILGDQKLMNMLSMVSQTQNRPTVTGAVNTISPIKLDSPKFSPEPPPQEDYDENPDFYENPNDEFSNTDEQTRSSFNIRQDPEEFDSFGKPDDFSGGNDDFNQGPESFNRGPESNNWNRDNFSGPDNFNRGPDNFNRAPDNFRGPGSFGGPDNINKGPDNFNKGPDNFNRGPDNFNRGSNNFNRGPSNFNRGPSEFNRGPDGFNRGPDDIRGPANFNRGPDNFNRGPNNLNRAPDNFNRGPDEARGPNNFNRGANNFNRGPDNFNRGPENFNKGPDNFKRGPDNFNRGPDNFTRGPGRFTGPDNYNREGSDQFGRGPDNFNQGPNFNRDSDNFEEAPEEFNRGPVNFRGPNNFNRNSDNFNRFNRGPNNFDRGPNDFVEGGDDFNRDTRGPNKGPDNFNRGSGDEGFKNLNMRPGGGPRPLLDDRFGRKPDNFNRERGSFDEESNSFDREQDECSGGSQNVNRGVDNLSNEMVRFEPPPNVEWNRNNSLPTDQAPPQQQELDKKVPPVQDEGIWKPNTVIDYDHKPLKPVEPDVIVETVYTFDYRHKPLNRIPYPQRPKWLSNIVKNYPEFDPAIARPFEQQLRRYPINERFDSRPPDGGYQKYEDRNRKFYDERERKPFNDRERPPYEERDRKPFNDHRKPYGEWDRKTNEDRNAKRSDEWERKPYDKKPFEDRRSRDFGDRRPDNQNMFPDKKPPGKDSENYKSNEKQDEKPLVKDKVQKKEKDIGGESFNIKTAPTVPSKSNVTLIEDLLSPPGRYNRPPRIVIILRGPPGSGKSFLAKLIKDKEVENGGSAPRILCLDDYFMVEQEKEVEEDGRKVKVKEMMYEFEECMEESYRLSLMKSFKKTITDGYFNFIIVDNINDKVKYFGEMWSYAKQNGFQVYICQMELDVQTCTKRNIHARSEVEIERCVAGWEPTPAHHPVLDGTGLIQSGSISEVEMEEINSPPSENMNEEPSSMAPISRSEHPEPWKTTSNWTTTGSNPFPANQAKRGFDGLTWKNARNKKK